MAFARILATGSYVPRRCLTNKEMDALYGRPVGEWLEENVGIRERHLAAEGEITSDLAVEAARRALEKGDASPRDIDLIIVATDTPDYLSPATSNVVQYKLGADRAGVFDVNNACAGFVTSLVTASKFIATEPERYSKVLVVGAYNMSRYLNWEDYKTATIFADGAGAALLGSGEHPGFLNSTLHADGSYHDYMGIYVGGTYCVPSLQALEEKKQYLIIAKRFPPDLNTRSWPRLVRELAQRRGFRVQEINRIYFTQVNVNTIKKVMAVLQLPLERTHWTMDKWGYTGSACIPMTLDDHICKGEGPVPGDLVVFCASGGGYAMAATAFRW
ncbi:MAG: 3-oxoacyl-ACP synthase III family protein [Acidobacteriota bacterium]